MIVSRQHRFVYVATPRTSSLSTCNWLRETFSGRREGGYHQVPGYRPKLGLHFTTVRNPFTRAQSIYAWVMQQHKDQYPDLPHMGWLEFLDWLSTGVAEYRHPNKVMLLSQSEFLGSLELDYVFKFEAVPECYRKLRFVGGRHLRRFPHNNLGTRPKPAICPKARELIIRWAGPDFGRFNYRKEWP